MNNTIEAPSLDGVAHVINGLTSEILSPSKFEQLQQDQAETRMSRRFVKGPIPLPWLSKALELTPSAVKCALALFYQRGLSSSDTFKIEPARFRELGIADTARRRGLRELEEHGLVRLQKDHSKSPVANLIGAALQN